MKKLFLILIFILFSTMVFGAESIQTYKPTYINFEKEYVVYQVSFKYGLWYPFNSGLYFSYSQYSKWRLYDQSSPFEESNYNPSVFWEKHNIIFLDYMRISPYSHISNGRDKEASRSLETGFLQLQTSYGKKINFGINETATWHYAVGNKNPDYKRYKGYFRTELFIQLKGGGNYFDQEKIFISGEWTAKSYWIEYGFTVRLLTKNIRPKLQFLGYYGTGRFLLNYKDFEKSFGIGITY